MARNHSIHQPGIPGLSRPIHNSTAMAGVRWWLGSADGGGLGTFRLSRGLPSERIRVRLTGDAIEATNIAGRRWLNRKPGLCGASGCAKRAARVCLPVGAFCTMDGLGKGLAFSQNFRTCAALGNGMGGDGVFTRVRLAFADAHFKCISVQVSTAAVSRSTRLSMRRVRQQAGRRRGARHLNI